MSDFDNEEDVTAPDPLADDGDDVDAGPELNLLDEQDTL